MYKKHEAISSETTNPIYPRRRAYHKVSDVNPSPPYKWLISIYRSPSPLQKKKRKKRRKEGETERRWWYARGGNNSRRHAYGNCPGRVLITERVKTRETRYCTGKFMNLQFSTGIFLPAIRSREKKKKKNNIINKKKGRGEKAICPIFILYPRGRRRGCWNRLPTRQRPKVVRKYHLDGRLNVHARSCISRETPTGNYAHGETARRGWKRNRESPWREGRARQKAAWIYVEKTTTTICQRLRDGNGSCPRTLSLSLSLSVSPSPSGPTERRKSGGKVEER